MYSRGIPSGGLQGRKKKPLTSWCYFQHTLTKSFWKDNLRVLTKLNIKHTSGLILWPWHLVLSAAELSALLYKLALTILLTHLYLRSLSDRQLQHLQNTSHKNKHLKMTHLNVEEKVTGGQALGSRQGAESIKKWQDSHLGLSSCSETHLRGQLRPAFVWFLIWFDLMWD